MSRTLTPYVIAEAGTCHGGSVERAKAYVDAAHAAGADAVKFQMFDGTYESSLSEWSGPGRLVSFAQEPSVSDIRDQMFCWIDGDEARAPRWLASRLTPDEWRAVNTYAGWRGIDLLFSTFEHGTAHFAASLNPRYVKVASRAAKDFPYDVLSGHTFLVSDGMYEPPDRPDVIRFQCEANYPSTSRWGGVHPGFSDHSGTPWRAVDALLRGCAMIEVHFFINPCDAGPDLPASLTLDQLRTVCEARDFVKETNQ